MQDTYCGFVECQLCAETEQACLGTRTPYLPREQILPIALEVLGPWKDKSLNKRRKFIFQVHSIHGHSLSINATNCHGLIKLQ